MQSNKKIKLKPKKNYTETDMQTFHDDIKEFVYTKQPREALKLYKKHILDPKFQDRFADSPFRDKVTLLLARAYLARKDFDNAECHCKLVMCNYVTPTEDPIFHEARQLLESITKKPVKLSPPPTTKMEVKKYLQELLKELNTLEAIIGTEEATIGTKEATIGTEEAIIGIGTETSIEAIIDTEASIDTSNYKVNIYSLISLLKNPSNIPLKNFLADEKASQEIIEALYTQLVKLYKKEIEYSDTSLLPDFLFIFKLLPAQHDKKNEYLLFLCEKIRDFFEKKGSVTEYSLAEKDIAILKEYIELKTRAKEYELVDNEIKKLKLYRENPNESNLIEVLTYETTLKAKFSSLLSKSPAILLDFYLLLAEMHEELNHFITADKYYVLAYNQSLFIKNLKDKYIDELQFQILEKRLIVKENQKDYLGMIKVAQVLKTTCPAQSTDFKKFFEIEQKSFLNQISVIQDSKSSPAQMIVDYETLIGSIDSTHIDKKELIKYHVTLADLHTETKNMQGAIRCYTDAILLADANDINPLPFYLERGYAFLILNPMNLIQAKRDFNQINYKKNNLKPLIDPSSFNSTLSQISMKLQSLIKDSFKKNDKNTLSLLKILMNLQKSYSFIPDDQLAKMYLIYSSLYFTRKNLKLSLKYANLSLRKSSTPDEANTLIKKIKQEMLEKPTSPKEKDEILFSKPIIQKKISKKPLKKVSEEKTKKSSKKPSKIGTLGSLKKVKDKINNAMPEMKKLEKHFSDIKESKAVLSNESMTHLIIFKKLVTEITDETQGKFLRKKSLQKLTQLKHCINNCEKITEEHQFIAEKKEIEKTIEIEKKEIIHLINEKTEEFKDISTKFNTIKKQLTGITKQDELLKKYLEIKKLLIHSQIAEQEISELKTRIKKIPDKDIHDKLSLLNKLTQETISAIKQLNSDLFSKISPKTSDQKIEKPAVLPTPLSTAPEDHFRNFFSEKVFTQSGVNKETLYESLNNKKLTNELRWLEALIDELTPLGITLQMRSSVVAMAMSAYHTKSEFKPTQKIKDVDFVSENLNPIQLHKITKILFKFGFKIKKDADNRLFRGFLCTRKTAADKNVYELTCESPDHHSTNYSYLKSPSLILSPVSTKKESKNPLAIKLSNKLMTTLHDPYNMLEQLIKTRCFDTALPDLNSLNDMTNPNLRLFIFRTLKDKKWCFEELGFTEVGENARKLNDYSWVRLYFSTRHFYISVRKLCYLEIVELIRREGFLQEGQLHIQAFLSVLIESHYNTLRAEKIDPTLCDALAKKLLPLFNAIFEKEVSGDRADIAEKLLFAVKFLIQESEELKELNLPKTPFNDFTRPECLLRPVNRETLSEGHVNRDYFLWNIESFYGFEFNDIKNTYSSPKTTPSMPAAMTTSGVSLATSRLSLWTNTSPRTINDGTNNEKTSSHTPL